MQSSSDPSLSDLLRSTDGTIERASYQRGAAVLGIATLGLIFAFYGLVWLRETMDWMTVAVAPFFGVLALFAASSLVYFWYCLFVKRHRALERSPASIYGWLLLLLAAAVFKLLDYQNQTLNLAAEGWLTYTDEASLIAAIGAVALFLWVLAQGFSKHRE